MLLAVVVKNEMTMAASCMLPTAMACCASSDVKKSHDTLRDVIPLSDALRDAAFTLSSHCQHLMMAPPVASSPVPPPPCPSTPPATHGMSRDVSSAKWTARSHRASPGYVLNSSAERPLPVLNVSSGDLCYRGEGAEHIVLRVLTSGQVLRLRKTAVGSVISAEDLLIRAYKDEEFLCNVARPILGPLLTDESQLIRIEAKTVRELKDTVEPKREVHRRHKEINSEGISCICPDAASIFISRCVLPSSSSSQTLPDSSSLSSLLNSCSTAVSLPPSNSVPTFCVSSERRQGRDSKPNSGGILPVSHEITQETKCGSNLRSSLPLSTISFSKDVSTDSRQVAIPVEPQVSSATEEVNGENCHDSIFSRIPLPTSPSLASVKPQNICIEIKPKQGFIDTSTPDLPLCRYCVKQYIKAGKNADHSKTSSYCPLDLFSGELARMRRAVDGLMESPQNNLKVFVDGEPVEDCKSFRYLRDVIIAALMYDFQLTKAELPTDGCLSPQSPLGRTLTFQKLDELGVYQAASLYADLVKSIGQGKVVDDLLQDLQCWIGDSHFCLSSGDLCSQCLFDNVQHINGENHTSGKNYLRSDTSHKHYDSTQTNNVENIECSSKSLSTVSCTDVKMSTNYICSIGDTATESFNQVDIIRKLQAYLLSTTAKDLSLMILLSGPYRSTPSPSNVPNASPFIIELETGVWFRCQVTGVDLVAKPPSKIFKHKQDYMQLKTVLEELKKQGKEPSCCRQ